MGKPTVNVVALTWVTVNGPGTTTPLTTDWIRPAGPCSRTTDAGVNVDGLIARSKTTVIALTVPLRTWFTAPVPPMTLVVTTCGPGTTSGSVSPSAFGSGTW